jgi:parallel beta-helix repeat protein
MASSNKVIGAVLAAAVFVAAPAWAAKCVNPGGTGGCFSTIQAAVSAAGFAETITVRPGRYNELVVIPDTKAGLKLVGGGATPAQVIVSGYGLSGPVIVVQADAVQVRNLTVANGDATGILVTSRPPGSPGVLISTVIVRGCGAAGIEIDNSGEVRSSRVQGCGLGITGAGPTTVAVRQNTVADCGTGISLNGHEVLISANRVTSCPQAIAATADVRAVIENNRVESAWSVGINANGTASGAVLTVRGNVVESYGTGIIANGDTVGVEGNTSLAASQTGIQFSCVDGAASFVRNNKVTGGNIGIDIGNPVLASGVDVAANTVHGSAAVGLKVKGNQNAIHNNLVYACGAGLYDGALWVDGSQNVLSLNKALNNGGMGIVVDSPDNRLTGNTSSGNVVGIQLRDNNYVVQGNTTLGNARYGIAIDAGVTGTTVQGSTAKGNLGVDFCDAGTGTALTGNTFGSTATSCP